MTYTPPTGAGNVVANQGTSGATLSASKPANLADDDLVVIAVYKQLGGTTFSSPPTGFNSRYVAVASGTRGLRVYTKKLSGAGSAAAEPSTYTVTASDSSARWDMLVFRLPGMIDFDAAPSSDAYNASSNSITDPACVAVAANTLGLAINFSNNSTAVFPVFSSAGWTALGSSQIQSGSSTSVLDVHYKEFTSAGSTGTATFTTSPGAISIGGFIITLAIAPVAASADMSGTGTLSASGTGGGSADTASLSGSGSLSFGTPIPAPTTSVALSGSGLLTVLGAKASDLATWLAKPGPRYCAHRDGFYATLGEFTVAGFQALAAWNRDVAWNIDVFKTSDGEWVASHDQTTGRVLSGTSLDIPSSTWASIAGKTTLVGGNPVARLDDIVAIAPPGTIFFIDNKQNSNVSAFFAKLAALGLGPGNVVNKNFVQSVATMTAARAAGYVTWAYAFDASAGDLVTQAANYDWTGFDYAGTQPNWNTAIGTGKPSFAHILASLANKATADSKAATAGGTNFGYMVSNVQAVIPAQPTLLGSGLLSAGGVPGQSGTAAMSGSGALSTSVTPAQAATASLSGIGALTTAASAPSASGTVSLAGSGALSTSGSPAAAASVSFAGTGTLSTSGAPSQAATASMTGTGTLTASGAPALGGGAALAGAGVLSASGAPAFFATASLSGSGTLAASAGSSGTGTAELSGTGTLTATGTPALAAGAVLSGSGALTATGAGSGGGSAGGSGHGQLTTGGTPSFAVTVSLSGSGTLSAIGQGPAVATVELSGAGTLTAVGHADIPQPPAGPQYPDMPYPDLVIDNQPPRNIQYQGRISLPRLNLNL